MDKEGFDVLCILHISNPFDKYLDQLRYLQQEFLPSD